MDVYFSGQKLYGDDFSISEINEWFENEREGYATIGKKDRKNYRYEYHQLNIQHGYSHIKKDTFDNVLGLGSAYGDELLPIISQIKNIKILDPSDLFSNTTQINDVPCEYIKPNSNGILPFDNDQFDLVTCFGVLHHIPNVSKVISECFRCLAKNGIMLVREPIVTMGDWTKPRYGLTKNERGIPLNIFKEIIKSSGFSIKNETLCDFHLLPRVTNRIRIDAYNNKYFTHLDYLLSQLFQNNIKYHRTKLFEKIAPSSIYFVLQK